MANLITKEYKWFITIFTNFMGHQMPLVFSNYNKIIFHYLFTVSWYVHACVCMSMSVFRDGFGVALLILYT